MAARLTAYVVVAIVAGTLIAGLIVGAQRDDIDGPVDLIVRNGKVYTADRRGTMAEAIAIRGNQILQVGTDREIARLQRPQTIILDARGAAVLPGFNDSKADLMAGGLALLSAGGGLPDDAAAPVASPIPLPDGDERRRAVRAAISHANALGITSVQHTVDAGDTLELYDFMRRAGELTVRVYAAVPISETGYPQTEADLAAYEQTRKKYPDDPLFKTGALAIRLDDAVGKRGAALLEPYEQSSEVGKLRFNPDDLNRMVRLADAAGWQVITEANGDRAVRAALNAYAHAVRSNRLPAHGRRHRIEGIDAVSPTDIERFGPLGVTASLLPPRSTPTADRLQRIERHRGADRAAATFPMASVAEETRVMFGTAWPLHTLNPFDALHMAVNQTAPDALQAGGWHERERMDLKAAIDAYTSTAAWASFDDQRKGVIAPGMLADLVVLSDDIFELPSEQLSTVSVSVTIFDGKVVYRRIPRAETIPVPTVQ